MAEVSLVFRRIVPLSETRRAVVSVAMCVTGIAISAGAMLFDGWHVMNVALGGMLTVLAGMLVLRLWRAMGHLHQLSSVAVSTVAESEEHYIKVLRRIVTFVEARERHGEGHSSRVGQLASRMAEKLALSPEQCRLLAMAGELHDIGLLAIPEGMLNQHSRIGVTEFRTIQKHSEVSYEILKPLASLEPVLPAIRHHHERMNGTGYPAGIREKEIPLGARILAVADAYDAMTHDRPHRAAMTPLAAMKELDRCTPHGYERECVDALAQVVHLGQLSRANAHAAAV